MSVLSKIIEKQVRKRGLTGLVMYIVKIYVKANPSKKDDVAFAKVEAAVRELEAI